VDKPSFAHRSLSGTEKHGEIWLPTAVLLSIVIALFFEGPTARAVSISLSPAVVGATPEIIGYNSGHFMPGSNTAEWWRYSGVNGARVWPTPSVVEGNDDMAPWGDGVDSEAAFLSRRSALRANPLNTTYINWPHFEDRYENNPTTGANIINLNHAFGALHEMGIKPVVEINRTSSAFPFDSAGSADGWADRWEHWQHFYAQAFYLAKNFDVSRFQMYNEPNHGSPADVTPAQFVERLQFASDAVQAAVADVNALYGKSLDPQMQAPVTAGSTSVYNSWGAPVMDALHTDFLGNVDPNFKLIDTYAYQQYNATGETFGSHLAQIKSMVNADAGSSPMRFAITEFNVHTAGTFDGMPETLDTPSKSARFGSILANLANNQPDELYIFKFSQGPGSDLGTVKKNGTHYVDNEDGPYNIGGVTKGGEVVRLFAKGFAGSNQLLDVPAASDTGASDLRRASAYNPEQNRFYLLSANEATSSRALSIDLTPWGIEPDARIIVEEVSADRHGEISHVITVPRNRVISLTQNAQSVLLFSVPSAAPKHVVSLSATDDAFVAAGSNSGTNFGTSADLFAKSDPVSRAARNVSFIKFNTGAALNSEIEQAILTVHGQNAGSASQVIAHVYGILNDGWSESTINWNNAPNLADANGAVSDIRDNFIEGIGITAKVVGHFTGIATSRELSIDVTSFVRDHPDQEITFLIAREVRFDGENVDDALTSLELASKERETDPGPQLLLSLSGFALAGDYNQNGVVEAADFDEWRNNFGSMGSNLSADGNRDGVVDAADYIMWRRNVGNSLPGAAGGGANAFVPEPATMLLGWLAFARCLSLRSRRF